MTERNKTDEQLAEIHAAAHEKQIEQLPSMTAEDLKALRALEAADKKPSKKLLEAIDHTLAELGKPGPTPVPKVEETPAWQKPDYVGSLTGLQAEWRMTHLKPDQLKPSTKPAAQDVTK